MIHAKLPRIVLLAGPTASGKSALALDLAARLRGAVVNADSMQVYRDLRVLTARPSPEDEARAPHLLYGQVDGASVYSVGRWLEDVEALLTSHRFETLIFVGGTGLYFDALTRGISAIPPVPEEVRTHWRDLARSTPSEDLHGELARRDAVMAARLSPADTQRILRALEVIDATGRSLSDWQESVCDPLVPPHQARRIVLAPERSELRRRIAGRFEQMVEGGVLDEVRQLLARRLDSAAPIMKALGVAPLADHLAGRLTLQEAIARSITDTHQYAKRQNTWFRNRMDDWQRYTDVSSVDLPAGTFPTDVMK